MCGIVLLVLGWLGRVMPLAGDPVRAAAGLRTFLVLVVLRFMPGVNVWEHPGLQLVRRKIMREL